MTHYFALVTGASSGMGFCYAKALAQRGYNLLMVSNETAIRTKSQEIQEIYPYLDIRCLEMNLGTPTAAKELFDYCVTHHIEVEVLINNAGVYHDRDFLDDSAAFNELILNLHILTPAMLSYYFGHEMIKRHKGYILNMSSITDRIAIQRMGTYGATKAFLSAHTRSLHVELKNQGVFVTAVRPGAVDTGLYSINKTATKIGRLFGYIVTPEHLVNRALKGLFRGQSMVSIPYIWNVILLTLVSLVSTPLLRLIRKLQLF